jgi:hypothetical protein
MIKAVREVVHGGRTAAEAYDYYQTLRHEAAGA